VEQSFAGLVVERMMSVSDAAATGVGRALERVTGIRTDSSADKGLWVVLRLVIEIVDAGEHCLDKYYSDTWPAEREIDAGPCRDRIGYRIFPVFPPGT
jgi:hypothetical protein